MTTGNSKLANGYLRSSEQRIRVRQQKLAGITSSTRGRTPLCSKRRFYCGRKITSALPQRRFEKVFMIKPNGD